MNREKLVKTLEDVVEIFFLLSVFSIPAGPVLKYIFQGVLLFTWIVKLIVKKRIEFNPTSLDYPILLFSILGFASVVINWTSFYQAGKGFSNLLEWFFAFYIVIHLIKRKEQVERFIKAWLTSAVIVTLYGWYQFIKAPGSFVNSFFTLQSYLAQYLILIIPVILVLFLFKKTKRERIFLGIIFLLTWSLLVFTRERGPWLGIIAGLLMMGFILRDKRILIGVPLLLILSFFISPSFIRIRAISIFQPRYSLERLYCWRSCLSMIKEHPLFGVGLGNFRYIYPKYMLGAAQYKMLHAHNIFFQVAVEMGIPGLLVFLWLLFNFFKGTTGVINFATNLSTHFSRNMRRDKFPDILTATVAPTKGNSYTVYLRALSVGFSAGIIAILVTSFFHDIFHSRQIATLTWYIIGMAIASYKLKDKESPGN